MADLQNINLEVDCHRFRLKVERSQEPVYRRAADTLNNTYKRYATRFPQKPVEELWVLVALEVAVSLHSDIREKDLKPVMEKLAELNEKIKEITIKNTKEE